MSSAERSLLDSIGKEHPQTSPTVKKQSEQRHQSEPAQQALPPLSLVDMVRLPATRGLFFIALLEPLFPRPFLQFDPLYLAERFNLTTVQAGAVMATQQLISSLIGPASAVVETTMIQRKWKTIDIRRWCSSVAFLSCAILWCIESRVSSLFLATAVRMLGSLLQGLHSAGQALASREVAGEDAGVFSAVMNSVQRADGFTGPLIIVFIRNRLGSWLPVFYWAAVGKCVQAVIYSRCVTTRNGRVLFAEMLQKRSATKER